MKHKASVTHYRAIAISLLLALFASTTVPVQAEMVTFRFDPDALIQSAPGSAGTSDVAGQNKATQENARRTHETWASSWDETFYNPASSQPQPNSYNTYMNWRDGLGAGEGISAFNIWLLDNPNARSWGETIVSRLDAPAGAATAADGWTAEVVTNPWGAGYFVQWSTDDSSKYINTLSDLEEFSFTVDAYVDVDGDGWDADDPGVVIGDSYRIWFGAVNSAQDWSVHFDDQGWGTRDSADSPWSAGFTSGTGYGSGFEGVLELQAVPVPGAVLLGMLGLSVAGAKLRRKRA